MSSDDASNGTPPQDEQQSEMMRSFAAAQRAAEQAPGSDDAWDHLEDLADKLQKPAPVAQLYRDALENKLAPDVFRTCLLYTSPSPRDRTRSRMPSSA